jgi:hypothetical protein
MSIFNRMKLSRSLTPFLYSEFFFTPFCLVLHRLKAGSEHVGRESVAHPAFSIIPISKANLFTREFALLWLPQRLPDYFIFSSGNQGLEGFS